MMDYSDFTVLLARDGSISTPLRSVLATHHQISCFPDVFALIEETDPNRLKQDSNFFNFVEAHARGDVRLLFPDRHEALFVDFLEYLRCLSEEAHRIVEITYGSIHFFSEPQTRDIAVPYLLQLIRQCCINVINVRRRNYLRDIILNLASSQSGQVHAGDKSYGDIKITLEPLWLLAALRTYENADRTIARHFRSYDRYLAVEDAAIWNRKAHEVSRELLENAARFLGVKNEFRPRVHSAEMPPLSLAKVIENYEEVRETLSGTRYENCLEDEPFSGSDDAGEVEPTVTTRRTPTRTR